MKYRTLTEEKNKNNTKEMEYGETSLSGVGDLELDPDIVSEEAGKLYSELQVKNNNTHLARFTHSCHVPN